VISEEPVFFPKWIESQLTTNIPTVFLRSQLKTKEKSKWQI
jgi:hypothetical protein